MTNDERLNNALIAAVEERDKLRAERDALHAKVVTVEALLRYPAFELIQRYFLGEYLGDEPWRAEILTLRNAAFDLSQQAERAEAERDRISELHAESQHQIDELRTQLAAAQERIEELKRENKEREESIATLRRAALKDVK